MAKRNPNLRAFVKFDKLGQVVPGSLILRYAPPEGGRGYFWKEIVADECCSGPVSNYEFSLNSGPGTGEFTITIDNGLVVDASNTQAGTYQAAGGQTVAISLTGAGPFKTLLVVDDSTGQILSNQNGTTGALTYSYVTPAFNFFSVIATSGPTTTSTTSTTTTTTTT